MQPEARAANIRRTQHPCPHQTTSLSEMRLHNRHSARARVSASRWFIFAYLKDLRKVEEFSDMFGVRETYPGQYSLRSIMVAGENHERYNKLTWTIFLRDSPRCFFLSFFVITVNGASSVRFNEFVILIWSVVLVKRIKRRDAEFLKTHSNPKNLHSRIINSETTLRGISLVTD